MSNRVTCINKTNRQSRWEAIRKLGGTRDDNGGPWYCTQDECIDYIKKGYVFYVELRPNHRVYLEIARSAKGNEYVRTEADKDPQDNLLSLKECP